MDSRCISANPDISGIGVRAAIYAQNFLCFLPVMAHLRDGTISAEEMKGVKDQSIGMLAVAFAILISTIIQATIAVDGQQITGFHAAIILDLSWMNNTSTWIWFLLYAHYLSKADKRKWRGDYWEPRCPRCRLEPGRNFIPATRSDWSPVVRSSKVCLHHASRLPRRPSCLGPIFTGTRAHTWFLPPLAHGCHWNLALAGPKQIWHPYPLCSNPYHRRRLCAILLTRIADFFIGDVFSSRHPWYQSSSTHPFFSRTSYRLQPVSERSQFVLGTMGEPYPKYPRDFGASVRSVSNQWPSCKRRSHRLPGRRIGAPGRH
ncbi:hypothetical protein C8J57DRAFT_1184934 [Mycena rebaudengoi]|nr:hypothetical protein C8J57DRAFT_1184934 [Mycena rebaudengoi]